MVLILSGEVHSGKTSLLRKLIPALQSRRLTVTGYLSEPLRKGEEILGYDLLEIGGDRFPFLRRGGPADRQRVGPFFMEEEGLRQAERIIRQAPPQSLLVVDEVGPLELEGKGVRSALEEALSSKVGGILLVIRRPILQELVASLGLESAAVIEAGCPDASPKLVRLLSKNLPSKKRREKI